ncbi:MAG: histidine phosphatase family protein [Candidatus Adlerbacteria bacterium]
MKKIYFVRHGESETNAGGLIKPAHEIALTELGHTQAEYVAQRAGKLGADIIISSSLLRARQTAEHIADRTELPVETSDLLVERRYPSIGIGLTHSHPTVKEVVRILEINFGNEDATHSDEETFEEMKERALRSLEYLKNRSEENIIVVTHAIFLCILVGVVLFGPELTRREAGKIINGFKMKNTGITWIEYDEEREAAPWYIRTWNDHAHLG